MQRPRNNAGRDKDGGSSSCRCGRPPLFWTRCCGRQAHRIGANRIGNIFDAMAAERTVIEIELVSDLIVDRLRDADGPGLGKRLEPGGNVDAVAKDVVAVANHIAEMTAD